MSTIAVPTLLVIGDNTIVTVDMAAELRELNPQIQVACIEGAGHGMPFDHPTQLARLIVSSFRA